MRTVRRRTDRYLAQRLRKLDADGSRHPRARG